MPEDDSGRGMGFWCPRLDSKSCFRFFSMDAFSNGIIEEEEEPFLLLSNDSCGELPGATRVGVVDSRCRGCVGIFHELPMEMSSSCCLEWPICK